MTTIELYLVAMLVIFAIPYLVWRLGNTERYAPLVVIQIAAGVALGPGVLGALRPELYARVLSPEVLHSLNGIAWWAVMLFVWIAGIELDLEAAWTDRRQTGVTALLALVVPLLLGAAAAFGLSLGSGWMGHAAERWQFVLGIGMACAVTALPILILFMEKLEILRAPIGRRILRYASIDDIAIWGVLALILLDYARMGRQLLFVLGMFPFVAGFRALMKRLGPSDRWYVGLIGLALVGLAADAAGLHFMVGAFLAGVILDVRWFEQTKLDQLRHHVLLIAMPVFFLITGLRTEWRAGGAAVFLCAGLLLLASVTGKLLGVHIAARIFSWPRGEAAVIGWLLQTKALIMIIFANVLLDKHIISAETFTALLLMAIGSTMLTIPRTTKLTAELSPEATRSDSD